MTGMPIRIILADDHAMVREGLRMVLEAQPDFDIVGEASDGHGAVDLAAQRQPHVALMDVTMPGMSGIEATQLIAGSCRDVKVLGLTVHENQEYFFRMLAAGASGYILKGATSAELVEAIRSVHQGGVFLTPVLAGHVVSEFLEYRDRALMVGQNGLTAREIEVFKILAEGLTNQAIADKLGLSIHTVQTHRGNIMRKLGLENRHQLMKYAIQKGLVETGS